MADVDGITNEAVQTDAIAEPAGIPEVPETPATEAPAADAPILQLGETNYTETQVREALEALENKSKWSAELSRKGEELNLIRNFLEEQRQQVINPQIQQPQVPQQPQIEIPSGEQLRDMILDRPQEAMATIDNLIKAAVSHYVGSAMGQMQEQQSLEQVRSNFLKEHGDFEQVVKTPEAIQFMREHPEYNPVNTYYKLKINELQGQLEAAKKAGFTAGEQAAIKNIQAKGNLKVLTGTGAAPVMPSQSTGPLSQQQLLESISRKIEARRAQAV